MGLNSSGSKLVKNSIASLLRLTPEFSRSYVKYVVERAFWRKTLKASDGAFYNGHMERAFTEAFGLDAAFFDGKRMLDIGCGPIGTLEWADGAVERVGADPLADTYVKMTKGRHKMKYVRAAAENLPFGDGAFDVVSMFNALDHVEDVDIAIREAVRVLAPGGTFLLIVELNHEPTVTEPHRIDDGVLDAFGCEVEFEARHAIREDHNVYGSVFDAAPPSAPDAPAVMCVRLRK